MEKIQGEEKILITMTATLEDGVVFDDIPADQPEEIQLGAGKLFPSLEKALVGMKPGESRTVQIPPEYGYGAVHKELIHTINKTVFGDKFEPQPGMVLSLAVDKDGTPEKVPATVVKISGNDVLVDFNHPLAGRTLIYTINLLSIQQD